jgi:hypothetical protein
VIADHNHNNLRWLLDTAFATTVWPKTLRHPTTSTASFASVCRIYRDL